MKENKSEKEEKEEKEETEHKKIDRACFHCGKKDYRIVDCFKLKKKWECRTDIRGDQQLIPVYYYWWTWGKRKRNKKSKICKWC